MATVLPRVGIRNVIPSGDESALKSHDVPQLPELWGKKACLKVILTTCLVVLAIYFFNSHLGERSGEASRLRDFATKLKQKVDAGGHHLHEAAGMVTITF